MRKKMYRVIILSSTLLSSMSNACTVWGAITPNELIIAKNRDFYPGNQKFETIHNKGKYNFFGLYGDNEYDNVYTIKMGINETGLTVFMTFASTLPIDQREAKIPYYKVMENILGNFSSVDSISNNSQALFKDSTPINYIFADRNKAIICEIGLENNFKCSPYLRSNDSRTITFAQTNHYILTGLEQYNLTPKINQQTSYYRYDKINELMKNNLDALTFKQFINFSFNTEATNDNPPAEFDTDYSNTYQDNSIFRTFNSHPDRRNKKHQNSDQNVSTMIVKLPVEKNKPIELYLRKINDVKDTDDKSFIQNIKYSEATTTLSDAINHTDSIKYTEKACIRNINSSYCINN